MSYEQVPVLKDRRNMLDVLEDIATNTSGSGGGSGAISDFETLLVLDANDAVMIRREVWNGTTTTITYENLAGDPVTPVLPIRPWAQPSGTASEATLAAMSAKLPASLGSKTGTASMSVVLASDQVMPLTRGVYQTGNGTAVSNGQAASIRVNGFGAVLMNQWLAGDTAGDGLANTSAKLNFPPDGGSGQLPMFGMVGFNGTSWDRVRGNTNGLFAQGPVASGATPAGNPLLQGGIYRAPSSVTANQVISLMMSQWGSIMTTTLPSSTQAADSLVNSVVAMPMQYNGSGVTMPPAANFFYDTNDGWSRMRGHYIDGLTVNPLKRPQLSRKIPVSNVATPVQLTTGTRAVSVFARGCDVRFGFSGTTFNVANTPGASSAAANTHFCAQTERLDVPALAWISVIADADSASQTGFLELVEY